MKLTIIFLVFIVLGLLAYIIRTKKELKDLSRQMDKSKGSYVNIHTTSLSNEIEKLTQNINFLYDENQRVNAAKKSIEEEIRHSIANMSHDLRTPLTSIINYVNILRQDITKDEKEDYLAIVEKKAKKLKVLIDDLFEMSKINSGKMELFKDNIDVVSLIHQTIGEYYYIYESKNIEFKVDSYREEVYIDLDGKLISRAIENIIINAMKYSLEGTRVYVDIREKDGYIVLSFKNISNYEMNFDNKEIFERFARGDSSRNSRIEGSGLGLAITKSIIELHDGKVYITREGDMFKIFIYLPLNKENEVDLG